MRKKPGGQRGERGRVLAGCPVNADLSCSDVMTVIHFGKAVTHVDEFEGAGKRRTCTSSRDPAWATVKKNAAERDSFIG